MQDWIMGLVKAASGGGPGASPSELEAVAAELRTAVPPEVGALYASLDGAQFRSGVTLFPLRGPSGVAARSREHLPGFADHGVWRLGERPDGRHLFAAHKGAIPPSALPELPSFWDQTADDAFVYGVKNEQTGELRLYRTLEQLLAVLVPPVETEEFGERTYARAMSLVQGALDTLKQTAERAVGEVNTEAVSELATRAAKRVRKVAQTIQKVRAAQKQRAIRANAATRKKPAAKKSPVKKSPAKKSPAKKKARKGASKKRR